MAETEQWVKVEERKLKLSNLEKVLYPDSNITKAQVINYYLNIAPCMLSHIKGRPLSLLRYPDGISEESFFQKQTPDWAPGWIKSVTLGEEESNDYVLVEEKASLVWLANLASLELHQMHMHRPNFNKPDYIVFDLDPAENSDDFEKVVDIAYRLKDHISDFGYHPFVKTSGRKGLHLFMPIKPNNGMAAVFEAAKDIAQPFVDESSDETTLQIKKKARKGRVLIDIYRNRSHQTIISPYSLRGEPGAPVSMPLKWEELSDLKSAAAFQFQNALDKVKADGDAWGNIQAYAAALHTVESNNSKPSNNPDRSNHYKTAEQLREYSDKRDFSKTNEPDISEVAAEGQRFVVQRHHATNLHYDLRLEQEGVLRSWAVPKGLPPRPGLKRLAVETENHPMEYLTFEGEIPEDEYGGGRVWVYALGEYEVTKQEKGSLHFRLKSEAVNGEYHLYHTKDNQWLLEREDKPQIDWLNDRIETMNAKSLSDIPEGDYTYEVKWDGVRALIALEDGEIKIQTRNGNNITDKFPELMDFSGLRANCALFDGEIVSLDEDGKPSFQKVINRLKNSSQKQIQKLSDSKAVYCYLFDCLYLDGRPIIDEPLLRRKAWLCDVVRKGRQFRISEFIEDGRGLLDAAKEHGLEGIMAKKPDSQYRPGKRSNDWLKVKTETTTDVFIIGYTKGSGDRSQYFGALHLAEEKDHTLIYRGKVGTGFDTSDLKEIAKALEEVEKTDKYVQHKIENKKDTTWVEPKLIAEVSYSNLTDDKLFRAAVFKRLRPDLYSPDDFKSSDK